MEPELVDPAHLVAVLEGLAQAKRREFATAEEMKAAFRRFGVRPRRLVWTARLT